MTPAQQQAQEQRNQYVAEMVKKAQTDEELFVAKRYYGLGGSDMSALLGTSKWRTPYELWMDKTFRGTKAVKNDLPFEVGHYLEALVAERYEQTTDYEVREATEVHMKEYPFLIGNFDRLVVKDGKVIGGLECKTTESNNKIIVNGIERSKWGQPNIYNNHELVSESSEIDPEYYAQVQFYLMVSGLTWWDVGVLINNSDLRFYRINRDKEFIDNMLTKTVDFWLNNVLGDVPPAMTYTDNQSTSWDEVSIQASAEMTDLVSKYKSLELQKSAIEEQQKPLLDKISVLMGNNSKATYVDENGKTKTLLTFKGSNRTSFDSKKFQQDMPDVYKRYQTTIQTKRSLRFY